MPDFINKRLNGFHVIEGSYNGQPMLTLDNDQPYNKMKNTGGVKKMQNNVATVAAQIEFLQKYVPGYKLPEGIEVVEDGGKKVVRIIKAS